MTPGEERHYRFMGGVTLIEIAEDPAADALFWQAAERARAICLQRGLGGDGPDGERG